jgi:hypothetical protein
MQDEKNLEEANPENGIIVEPEATNKASPDTADITAQNNPI